MDSVTQFHSPFFLSFFLTLLFAFSGDGNGGSNTSKNVGACGYGAIPVSAFPFGLVAAPVSSGVSHILSIFTPGRLLPGLSSLSSIFLNPIPSPHPPCPDHGYVHRPVRRLLRGRSRRCAGMKHEDKVISASASENSKRSPVFHPFRRKVACAGAPSPPPWFTGANVCSTATIVVQVRRLARAACKPPPPLTPLL